MGLINGPLKVKIAKSLYTYYSLLLNNHSLLMNMKNTSKILGFLLRNRELYNINQIARTLNLSVGSAHKILKSLEERNVVNIKELGNASYYNLNFKSQEAVKLIELILIEEKNNLLKENKIAKVYVQDIEKFNAKCIILFGSILYKEEQAKDVDVLFLIKSKEEVKQINKFCLEISKIRTKKVNPLILLEEDLIENIKNQNKAIIDIIKSGIILKGEETFVKIIKNAC